ncbi:MAG: HEPN domain-containing protein [Candidatus Heimdallarchaeaceae archaeon]
MDRSKDWFAQAEHLLEQAKWSLKGDFYDGVCFLAQQSSELAIKVISLKLKLDYWEHTASKLLNDLKNYLQIQEEIIDSAKKLDKYYIPTRSPNGFDSGSPKDYFTKEETIEVIKNAEEIIKFCRENLQK